MAKRFTVPSDITVVDPITRQSVGVSTSFRDFALKVWLSDERIGNSPPVLRRLISVILPAFEKSAGDAVTLEDQDYTLLYPIVEAPRGGLTNPLLNAQLLPFVEAFLKADTVQL